MAILEPDVKVKKLNKRQITKITLVVLAIAIVVALAAKPSYQIFRDWRISSNANSAERAFDMGNYDKARRLALTVLKYRKDDYPMLKLLQRSMSKLRDPQATSLAIMLMHNPECSEEDRLLGITIACQKLPLASAAQLWISLGPERRQTPDYLLPFVTRLIDEGVLDQAAQLLLSRSELDTEPELHLQAMRMWLDSDEPAMQKRGQYAISNVMFNDADLQLEAFRLLSNTPPEKFQSGYFSELKDWISKQEEATVSDRLLAQIQELQRRPNDITEITEAAVMQYAEREPLAVTSWLLQLGRAEQALALLPAETSSEDPERFRHRAQALIALERWQEAYEWLAEPPEYFPITELHCLRIECSGQMTDSKNRSNEWPAALNAAKLDTQQNAFLELHRRMLQLGNTEFANEAMVEAVILGRGRLPIWAQVRHLLPWIHQHKTAATLYNFCSVMSKLEPGDFELGIELLDSGCILGKSRPDSVVDTLLLMGEKIQKLRELLRYKETLASAYLLNDQPAEALSALSGVSSDSPRAQVVSAIATIRLSQDPSSEPVPEIDWDAMFLEEAKLFKGLLKQAGKDPSSDEIAPLPEPSPLPKLKPLPEPAPLPKLVPMPKPQLPANEQ